MYVRYGGFNILWRSDIPIAESATLTYAQASKEEQGHSRYHASTQCRAPPALDPIYGTLTIKWIWTTAYLTYEDLSS